MRTTMARILLVPAAVCAALAFTATTAQAAPATPASTVSTESLLGGGGHGLLGGNSGGGILDELLDSIVGDHDRCGLLNSLLGGCHYRSWHMSR